MLHFDTMWNLFFYLSFHTMLTLRVKLYKTISITDILLKNT